MGCAISGTLKDATSSLSADTPTAKYRLPTISNANQYAEAGLVMSYGPKLEDLYRRAAIYVDKFLRGEPCPPTCQSNSPRGSS